MTLSETLDPAIIDVNTALNLSVPGPQIPLSAWVWVRCASVCGHHNALIDGF